MRFNYKGYLLAVLMMILAFNNVDRFVLGLVLQDIKIEFQLSDTQLGFLTGIAYAFFYAVMGIPIARWADRGNRATIISVTTALWSAAMMLCGMAANFLQLLLFRVAAAIGEAGSLPPSHSLIADYFKRGERPKAVSRLMLSLPMSVAIGFFGAGWLNELYGWRTTFLVMGMPGLVLAALALLSLKEPRHTKLMNKLNPTAPFRPNVETVSASSAKPSLSEVFSTLWANTTFRQLLIGYSVSSFFIWGIQQWQAAFFIRSFELETGELGTWFTMIGGVFGLLGTCIGGEVASRYAPYNEPLQLKGMAVALCMYAAISIFAFLASNEYLAFGLMAVAAVALTATLGPFFALIQTLVLPRMRALSIAIVLFFANLIGMGLGPLTVGALSDLLRPWLGEESLRYALVAMWPGVSLAGWCLWRASGTVERDLRSVSVGCDDGARAEGEAIREATEPLVATVSTDKTS